LPLSPSGPLQNGVVITGLEPYGAFLLLLETVQLRATFYRDGKPQDCTQSAKWTSSNGRVLALYRPGFFGANSFGESDLTATCGQQTGSVRARVDRYKLRGTVRDPAGHPIKDVALFLGDGPDKMTDDTGRFDAGEGWGSVFALRFTKPGFEPLNITYPWSRVEMVDLNLVMSRLGSLILEGSGMVTPFPAPPVEYQFHVEKRAEIRIDTYAGVMCNDYCFLAREVLCNDSLLKRDLLDRGWWPSSTFVTTADPSCTYRLRFSPVPSTYVPFRFGVTAQ